MNSVSSSTLCIDLIMLMVVDIPVDKVDGNTKVLTAGAMIKTNSFRLVIWILRTTFRQQVKVGKEGYRDGLEHAGDFSEMVVKIREMARINFLIIMCTTAIM